MSSYDTLKTVRITLPSYLEGIGRNKHKYSWKITRSYFNSPLVEQTNINSPNRTALQKSLSSLAIGKRSSRTY